MITSSYLVIYLVCVHQGPEDLMYPCGLGLQSLQRVVDKVKEWCDQWLLSLNVTKCYHMSYSSRQSRDTSYYIQQKESASNFQKVDYIKDLGVFFDSQLTFSEHIHQKNQ